MHSHGQARRVASPRASALAVHVHGTGHCHNHRRGSSSAPAAERDTRVRGTTYTARDFAMAWDDTAMHSTHEITYDPCKPGFVWVSGMMGNEIARVSVSDPLGQTIFQFQLEGLPDPQPHTIRFDSHGRMWVGLENVGLIVQIDRVKLAAKMEHRAREMKQTAVGAKQRIFITRYDLVCGQILDVHVPLKSIHGKSRGLNSRPHGFCFDSKGEKVWFTGKLTNTVGCVPVDPHTARWSTTSCPPSAQSPSMSRSAGQ
jgi:streptogramin lyase